jgi:hypothetical protein
MVIDLAGGKVYPGIKSIKQRLSSPASRNSQSAFGWMQEKSRLGATPDGFLMRLPARHCSGSAASVLNPDATWLTQS